jgi:hypothetical protein
MLGWPHLFHHGCGRMPRAHASTGLAHAPAHARVIRPPRARHKRAQSDGTISAGEVDWFDTKMGFQGSPAIAPDVLAIAPCDGMAVFMTPEGQLRAKQSRRS